jgi:hypothetical protein
MSQETRKIYCCGMFKLMRESDYIVKDNYNKYSLKMLSSSGGFGSSASDSLVPIAYCPCCGSSLDTISL